MGASGWSYFVPYEADLESALKRLQSEVRKSGKFYKGEPEDGTHSILDMSNVSVRAVPRGADPGFGVVAPLSDADLQGLLGTAQPTRAMVKARAHDLVSIRKRWRGTCVVVYADGEPAEIFFTGFSGD